MTSTIVLSFPFFCSNKGFIGTFIGFRPYLRDLLRMQKSIQSLDMTNCGDEEPLKVFLSNLPIFSCWKCYTIESLFGKMSSGLTLLSNSGFSRLLMLVLEKYLEAAKASKRKYYMTHVTCWEAGRWRPPLPVAVVWTPHCFKIY